MFIRLSQTILFLSLFLVEGVFAQQVIWLKNGEKYNANVKFRTIDTLVYVLPSNPEMMQWVLMKEVDKIQNLNPLHKILWDTLPETIKKERCVKIEKLKEIGIGCAIGGAIVTGAGLILIIPAALKDFNHVTDNPDWVSEQLTGGAILCALGTVTMLTGIILVSTSNSKLKKYSLKHQKLTFDINFTPSHKGFSMVYRF